MLLGIDVSHHTGPHDWRGLAGKGVKFAFIKATEGATYTDDLFTHHWQGLHDAGVPSGAYHYGRPGTDPATQASPFRSVVGELKAEDLQPVLDLEVDDGHSPSYVLDWTLKFVENAESLFGAQIVVYTGGFWRNKLGNPSCPQLSARRLWTARYGGQPVLPNPWTKWSVWQFSDGIHSKPPEAAVLKCNCDWNYLANDLSVDALTVKSNPLLPPNLRSESAVPWPGRFFTFPSTPPISGDDVRQWQEEMTSRGWVLNPDGVYGPDSKTACTSLQRQESLPTDGIVGPKTWQVTFSP